MSSNDFEAHQCSTAKYGHTKVTRDRFISLVSRKQLYDHYNTCRTYLFVRNARVLLREAFILAL